MSWIGGIGFLGDLGSLNSGHGASGSGPAPAAEFELLLAGLNNNGNTLQGTSSGRTLTPTLPADAAAAAMRFSKVSAGAYHALGIKSDGTLWAWGANASGQLGLGDTTDRTVAPVQVGTDADWAHIAAGHTCSFAIKADGSLWSWGLRDLGRLGDGLTSGTVLSPQQILLGKSWKSISAHAHALAVRDNGEVWSWGANGYGQLGQGTTTPSSPFGIATPALMDAGPWLAASAAGNYSLGLKLDGTLWSWGRSHEGQLGLGDLATRTSPVQVGTDTDWAAVDASAEDSSFALKSNGSLWSWGITGPLRGNGGAAGDVLAPEDITPEGIAFTSVQGGYQGSWALDQQGRVFYWGSADTNNFTSGDVVVPTLYDDGYAWRAIAGGVYGAPLLLLRDPA